MSIGGSVLTTLAAARTCRCALHSSRHTVAHAVCAFDSGSRVRTRYPPRPVKTCGEASNNDSITLPPTQAARFTICQVAESRVKRTRKAREKKNNAGASRYGTNTRGKVTTRRHPTLPSLCVLDFCLDYWTKQKKLMCKRPLLAPTQFVLDPVLAPICLLFNFAPMPVSVCGFDAPR